MFYQIFILVSVLMSIYFWKQRHSYYLSWKLRGPIGFPFIGGALSFKNPNESLGYMSELEKTYKSPYTVWMGPRCAIISSDPDTMETVLTSPKCVNKNFVYNFVTEFIGDSLFTANVPLWNTRNKIIQPTFKRRMILGFYSIFNEYGNELNKTIEENLNNENFFLSHHVQMAVLKSTCRTTLGDSGSEVEKIDYFKLLKAYSVVMAAMVERMFQPLYYQRNIYKLTNHYKHAEKYATYLKVFLKEKIIAKKISVQEELSKTNSQNSIIEDDDDDMKSKLPPSLLEYILVKNEHNLSIDELRSEVAVLIVANFETTAVALYTTILCLAMNSDKQEKLYEELCNVFPNKNVEVTEEHLKQLTYTEMCIKEAMRLVSPVPVVGRITMDNVKLKNGVELVKDTEIILDIFNLQRSEKHWGPNAKKFNPENFHPDNIKNHHPYAYIPFTKGSRMCVGLKYSLVLMKIFVAKVHRNYKISTDMKFEELQFVENISMKLRNHPTFKFEKRE